MMIDVYILEDKKPKKVDGIIEWAKWMSKERKRTRVRNSVCGVSINGQKLGNVTISTIFLGVDSGLNQRS